MRKYRGATTSHPASSESLAPVRRAHDGSLRKVNGGAAFRAFVCGKCAPGEALRGEHDAVTVIGAAVVVAIFAVLGMVAAFGPEALGGLFSATGAAWVQAVGSVSAILVAIWVSSSAERRSQHAASEMAALFKACMLDGSHRLLEATRFETMILVQRSVGEIQDGFEIGRTIELGRLPPQEALQIVRIRTAVTVLLVEANDLISRSPISVTSGDFGRLKRMTEITREKILEIGKQR